MVGFDKEANIAWDKSPFEGGGGGGAYLVLEVKSKVNIARHICVRILSLSLSLGLRTFFSPLEERAFTS